MVESGRFCARLFLWVTIMIKILTLLIFLSFTSLFILFTSPALATENWVIDKFQSQINIRSDGKVEITETIDVDFSTLAKHGIFRDIPYIYPTNTGTTIYSEIQILNVLQDGSNARYQSSKEGNFLRLKIGDPSVTLLGKREYVIKYLTTGVLRGFEDHDELYWDVTGNGWPVPIIQVSTTVILPQNGVTATTCFQGVINSKEKCISKVTSQKQATFQSTRSFNSSEGLTIVLGYTKSMVPILAVNPPDSTTYTSSGSSVYPPNGWVFLITSILGIGLIFWWWKKTGQENPQGAVMVEYSAPDNLRPAEVGTLLDERADTLDVSATIIDLAARGFLTIEEKEKKWLFGSTDYIFSRKSKDEDDLLNYEKELLDRIFAEGDIINLSELESEFYDDLVRIKSELYKNMVNKKYFPTNPEKVKGRYMTFGAMIMILSIFIAIFGFFESSGILSGVGLALIVVGFVLLILSRSFAKRTSVGSQAFRKILGFKLFMEKVETYKQRFMEKENLFNEFLPYAIVFGITEKFAQAFKDLGLKPPQPSWYISNRPFNPILFSSSINSFSSSLTSAIASQPSRSHSFVSSGSGFSSSGSSGGGFGGGGGGSW